MDKPSNLKPGCEQAVESDRYVRLRRSNGRSALHAEHHPRLAEDWYYVWPNLVPIGSLDRNKVEGNQEHPRGLLDKLGK
jgi:hypothetical protein